MKRKTRIMFTTLPIFLMATLIRGQVNTIAVPNTSWVKVGGDQIYYVDPRDPKHTITRHSETGGDSIYLLHGLAQQLPNRQISLFALYADPKGNLYVCYSATLSDPMGPRTTVIARVDLADNSITKVWSDDELLPRSFAVGPSGAIFALGLTRKQELQLHELAAGSLSANIFHIIDPVNGAISSLMPISIDGSYKGAARSLLSSANIVFRKNGNALISFNPVFARTGNWAGLLTAREYARNGAVTATYQSSAAPVGADVAAILVDQDDSLLIQYVTITLSQSRMPGVQMIHRGESSIIRFPAHGGAASKVLSNIPSEERMIGIRDNGQIVTEIPGKRVIRIRPS